MSLPSAVTRETRRAAARRDPDREHSARRGRDSHSGDSERTWDSGGVASGSERRKRGHREAKARSILNTPQEDRQSSAPPPPLLARRSTQSRRARERGQQQAYEVLCMAMEPHHFLPGALAMRYAGVVSAFTVATAALLPVRLLTKTVHAAACTIAALRPEARRSWKLLGLASIRRPVQPLEGIRI